MSQRDGSSVTCCQILSWLQKCPNARMPVKVQKSMKSLYTELCAKRKPNERCHWASFSWRKVRDSNPRYPKGVYRISSPARSITLPTFLTKGWTFSFTRKRVQRYDNYLNWPNYRMRILKIFGYIAENLYLWPEVEVYFRSKMKRKSLFSFAFCSLIRTFARVLRSKESLL